jgi:hypothetical protein
MIRCSALPRPFPVLGLALLVAGCQSFPELDAAAAARLQGTPGYPELVPVDEIVVRAGTAQVEDADLAALVARVSALQGRAGSMQGPVVDPDTGALLVQAAGG